MYNETLYEVERVVQIRWVKSNSLTNQTGSTASSSGEDMMISSTPGNPKTTSPSATTTKLPKKKMTTQSTKKSCPYALPRLTTTKPEPKRNLLQKLAARQVKWRRKKTLHSWKSSREGQRLVIICSPLRSLSRRSTGRCLRSERRVICSLFLRHRRMN